MGTAPSNQGYLDSLKYYDNALGSSCMLPDIGIDESLLKYSGTDSNAQLQTYSNELVSRVPGFIQSLGASLGALSAVPNGVGLGALVISMIMELFIKGSQTNVNSYDMLRRVFGEEKASAVRDTMSEYLMRHKLYINNNQRLKVELRRLEQQLNRHLVILRNSLLHDGQMSTRGFKIWVNGASFHVQMLIHEARLNVQSGEDASHYVTTINVAIGLYLQNLDKLLEKYKTFKISTTKSYMYQVSSYYASSIWGTCYLESNEPSYCYIGRSEISCPFNLVKIFTDHVFSNYPPIVGLKNHFLNVKNNLRTLINQRNSFALPSAG